MNYKEKRLQEFDEKLPCVNRGCDNNGSIAHQVGEDDWEQEQCQWCDEVRLPFKQFLSNTIDALTLKEDDVRKVVGKVMVSKERRFKTEEYLVAKAIIKLQEGVSDE